MKEPKSKADPEVENKKQQEYWRLAKEAYGRKDWDAAEMYYTKAIRAAPKNAKMYVFRGGVRCARAQSIKDRRYYVEVLGSAVSDYHKALESDPDDGEVAVSLLEVEICSGRIDDAVAHADELWQRIQQEHWRTLCGWMGAIACALAGRLDKECAQFRDVLPKAAACIAATSWNTGDIEKYLMEYAEEDCPPERVQKALEAHRIVVGQVEQVKEDIDKVGPVIARMREILQEAATVLAKEGGTLPSGKSQELERALDDVSDAAQAGDAHLREWESEARIAYQRIALANGVRLANRAVEMAKGEDKNPAREPYMESLDWLEAAAKVDPDEPHMQPNVPVAFANCAGFLAACMFEPSAATAIIERGLRLYPDSEVLKEQSAQLSLLRIALEGARELPQFSAKVPSSAGQVQLPRDFDLSLRGGSGLYSSHAHGSLGFMRRLSSSEILVLVIIGGLLVMGAGWLIVWLIRYLVKLLGSG